MLRIFQIGQHGLEIPPDSNFETNPPESTTPWVALRSGNTSQNTKVRDEMVSSYPHLLTRELSKETTTLTRGQPVK